MVSQSECHNDLPYPTSDAGEPWCCEQLHAPAEASQVLATVAADMTGLTYGSRDIFAVKLGLEEAISNALKHGNGRDPAKRVRIRYRVTADRVVAQVADDGAGFDLLPEPEPAPQARQKVWREGIAPLLSTPALVALERALVRDDPRLIQGETCKPAPVQAVQDWPVEGACLVRYCGWQGDDRAAIELRSKTRPIWATLRTDRNSSRITPTSVALAWK
jgi:serine/threonine-protein kinase RsbW